MDSTLLQDSLALPVQLEVVQVDKRGLRLEAAERRSAVAARFVDELHLQQSSQLYCSPLEHGDDGIVRHLADRRLGRSVQVLLAVVADDLPKHCAEPKDPVGVFR